MRLKNKKTGEIALIAIDPNHSRFTVVGKNSYLYDSLAELNEEWEDYEEPSKTIWQIKDSGELQDFEEDDFSDGYIESSKSIGNYFDTEEEAEKAVEKLKCFTNLKNHEFMFDGWYYGTDGNIVILANAHEFNDMEEQDLTKVFGEKIC